MQSDFPVVLDACVLANGALCNLYDVEALHPQDYLLVLWSMNSKVVMSKLAGIAKDRGEEISDSLICLGKSVPRFACQVIEEIGPDYQIPGNC